MHSASLLVIDQSPEYAERVRALLLDSGIDIHVLHVLSSTEVKQALQQHAPVLILFAEPGEGNAVLEDISDLADASDVPLALLANLGEPARLATRLARTACYVIDASSDELLTAAVRRLVRKGERQGRQRHKDTANELAAEIERLRLTDPLTQLHNGKAFAVQLENWLAGDGEGTAGVLYIEPDGFRAVREELGVDAIDAFIADLASVLRASLEPDDIAARISDRGFAVLAHRKSKGELETLAETILATCRSHVVEIDNHSLTFSCSIGLSNVGRMVVDAAEIISRAREAQTEAAERGDQLVVYRPQLAAVASADSEQLWAYRIRHALERNAFYTVQQSIIDLDGEGKQLFENQLFMRGEGGDHAGAAFQDAADHADLAGQIDRQVLGGLLGSLADAEDPQIINLSANSIRDHAFPGWFADNLRSACAPGDKVILQITAVTAQGNLRPVRRLMKELEPLGCQLSISDFDGRRRCIQLLQHLDVSFVKLHPRLTDRLTGNAQHQEIIRKIVAAAGPRGVALIADEVADTSSLAILWQCGVNLVAGSFLRENTQVLAQ